MLAGFDFAMFKDCPFFDSSTFEDQFSIITIIKDFFHSKFETFVTTLGHFVQKTFKTLASFSRF